ncbi:NADPH-dependent FMN reductase [Pseudaquidulcibacter saccharophilus]|uniref:NADPH-dependent FMN reductase n=1 Tax=Pseudaquidulcibacter saccharophilus TaxID=2831900 RepID=UPI001EFF3A38|nr:NAD(P)H-dependent oxidoreductase [Pseudaquidulcibacter saccharophilus]
MKLNIIITSTRPNRVSPCIGKWFYEVARQNNNGLQVVLTDLADVNLPLLDEPYHPSKHQYLHEHTKIWSNIIETSDAFVFILPEYNSCAPPSFVNAIDYLYNEWNFKPVGFVGYGAINGGRHSVDNAKNLMEAVMALPVEQSVIIEHAVDQMSDDKFIAKDTQISAAKRMIESIAVVASELREMRTPGNIEAVKKVSWNKFSPWHADILSQAGQ